MLKLILFTLFFLVNDLASATVKMKEDFDFETGIQRTSFLINEKESGIIEFDKDGNVLQHNINLPDGPLRTHYSSGSIQSEAYVRSKVLDGVARKYYESGILKETIIYVNGKPDGIKKSYYTDSKLESEMPYKNGKGNGQYREYYSNGSIMEEVLMENGMKTGLEHTYYENGNLWIKGAYHNGKKDGQFEWYDSSGTIDFLMIYKEGNQLPEINIETDCDDKTVWKIFKGYFKKNKFNITSSSEPFYLKARTNHVLKTEWPMGLGLVQKIDQEYDIRLKRTEKHSTLILISNREESKYDAYNSSKPDGFYFVYPSSYKKSGAINADLYNHLMNECKTIRSPLPTK